MHRNALNHWGKPLPILSNDQLLDDTRRIILKHEEKGTGISNASFKKLGFKGRDLTENERKRYSGHVFSYMARDSGTEITIYYKELERSRTFATAEARFEITLVVKNLTTDVTERERFRWDESGIFT